MIVVLADDITGAAEIAGIAHRFGYQTEVQIGSIQPSDAEVLVIDTNTRSKSETEAAKIIVQLMKELESLEYQLLYKKTDSALRGHIAAEIDTIIKNSNYSKVIFAPANPSLGRTMEQGIYFINGKQLHETDFARDPEFPALTSRISEVIKFKNQAIVPDLLSVESFSEIVEQFSQETLAAGGGDFFAAILDTFNKPKCKPESELIMPEKSIMVLGSLSKYSQQFFTCKLVNGAEYWPVSTVLISGDETNEQVKWIEATKSALDNQNNILLKLDGIMSDLLTPKEVAGRFSVLLMSLINEINHPLHILIEGGSTASSFFSTAGITSFEVVKEHQRGIVSLKSGSHPDKLFTIKPGSYIWPELLVQSLINNLKFKHVTNRCFTKT